ncbi:HMG high mobility group box-containing protein [Nitzschia inconspicua]|uniref:HMG high mobility group box-containing protein n=1 Tax=Nitzschia inconspicua TaxID=303405 RepID=A0A9K3K6M2_9STRA|nr:HMG high mobility group box-containing protein [Nitzschia inconspicua]
MEEFSPLVVQDRDLPLSFLYNNPHSSSNGSDGDADGDVVGGDLVSINETMNDTSNNNTNRIHNNDGEDEDPSLPQDQEKVFLFPQDLQDAEAIVQGIIAEASDTDDSNIKLVSILNHKQEYTQRDRGRVPSSPSSSSSFTDDDNVPQEDSNIRIDPFLPSTSTSYTMESKRVSVSTAAVPDHKPVNNNTDKIPKKKSKKKRKKKKEDGLPKRPLSAYNLFFQAKREEMLSKLNQVNSTRPPAASDASTSTVNTTATTVAAYTDPLLSIPQQMLGKIIGKQWRELPHNEKKIYQDMAERDCERYRREMEVINLNNNNNNNNKRQRLQTNAEEDPRGSSTNSSNICGGDRTTSTPATLVSPSNSPAHIPRLIEMQTGNLVTNTNPEAITPRSTTVVGSTLLNFHPSNPNIHQAQFHRPRDYPESWPLHMAMPPGMEIQLNINSNSQTNAKDEETNTSTFYGQQQHPANGENSRIDTTGRVQRYRVNFTCVSMSRFQANRQVESFLTRGMPVAMPVSLFSNHHHHQTNEAMSVPLMPPPPMSAVAIPDDATALLLPNIKSIARTPPPAATTAAASV